MRYVKNSSQVFFTLCVLLSAATAVSDRLYHIDGSTVEGHIVSETPDKIVIETKYGNLNYQRSDIVKIERTAAAVTATTGTAEAAPVNLMRYIPQGPVNPLAPPQIPALVTLAPNSTSRNLATSPTPAH